MIACLATNKLKKIMGSLHAWMSYVYWVVILFDEDMDQCSGNYDLVFVAGLTAIHDPIFI